jgi:hypothetical protein
VYLSDAERDKLDALLGHDGTEPPPDPRDDRGSSRASDIPELRMFVLFRAALNGRLADEAGTTSDAGSEPAPPRR